MVHLSRTSYHALFKAENYNKTNFYKVDLDSVKVRDRLGMGKGQVRDGTGSSTIHLSPYPGYMHNLNFKTMFISESHKEMEIIKFYMHTCPRHKSAKVS